MNRRLAPLGLLMSAILMLAACGKNEPLPIAPTNIPAPPPVQPAAVPEAPKEKPVYVYSGDRFRDPFTPAGQTTNYQPDALFDPARVSVKAIIYGKKHRSAVLSMGGAGTYFAKAGRIFDIMGKTVDGFSAKVYENRVVIVGEADNTFELKLRNDEEEKTL